MDRRYGQRAASNGRIVPLVALRVYDRQYESRVVLFGERLPERAPLWTRSLSESADAYLIAGSSLSVEPAASLPRTATERGATVVVTLEPTPLSDRAEYDFRADATEALPRLAEVVLA